MKRIQHAPIITILTLIILGNSGCFQHYYTTQSLTPLTESDVAILREPGRKVFIHFEDRTMTANIVGYNDGILEGTLAALPGDKEPDPAIKHTVGLHKVEYSKVDQVTAQIHVFTDRVHSPENESLVLPLVDIREIQYQHYDASTSIILAISVTGVIIAAFSGGVMGPINLNDLGI